MMAPFILTSLSFCFSECLSNFLSVFKVSKTLAHRSVGDISDDELVLFGLQNVLQGILEEF
jgi:hypothetical protein